MTFLELLAKCYGILKAVLPFAVLLILVLIWLDLADIKKEISKKLKNNEDEEEN